MKWFKLSYLMLYFAACSCGESAVKQQSLRSDSSKIAASTSTTSNVFPSGNAIDSIQVLYYDDPYGDSLRYTRYFTFTTVTEPQFFERIVGDALRVSDSLPVPKKCRSEGKMFIFSGKEDEPVKTFYFSTQADSCRYLYYIQNGLFIYTELSDSLSASINRFKGSSVAPVSRN